MNSARFLFLVMVSALCGAGCLAADAPQVEGEVPPYDDDAMPTAEADAAIDPAYAGMSQEELEQLALDTARAERSGDFVSKARPVSYYAPYSKNRIRAMESVSTHVCMLTKLRADATGALDRRVYIKDGTWMVTANDDNGVAYATCYPHNDFRSDGSCSTCPAAHTHSVHGVYQNSAMPDLNTFNDTDYGDYATMLVGVDGRFTTTSSTSSCSTTNTYPLAAYVDQSLSLSSRSRLYVDHWNGDLRADSAVVVPDMGEVVQLSSEYSATAKGGDNKLVWLKSSDTHMCYFTYFGGDMRNNSEAHLVDTIRDGVNTWYLRVTGNGPCNATAKARCIELDQR